MIFLTEKHILSEKDLLEKPAPRLKRFECSSPSGKENESSNWHCKETASKIRQYLWISSNN